MASFESITLSESVSFDEPVSCHISMFYIVQIMDAYLPKIAEPEPKDRIFDPLRAHLIHYEYVKNTSCPSKISPIRDNFKLKQTLREIYKFNHLVS